MSLYPDRSHILQGSSHQLSRLHHHDARELWNTMGPCFPTSENHTPARMPSIRYTTGCPQELFPQRHSFGKARSAPCFIRRRLHTHQKTVPPFGMSAGILWLACEHNTIFRSHCNRKRLRMPSTRSVPSGDCVVDPDWFTCRLVAKMEAANLHVCSGPKFPPLSTRAEEERSLTLPRGVE